MQDAEFTPNNLSLAQALTYLADMIELEGSENTDALSIDMPPDDFDRALALIERARQEDQTGNRDSAWYFFSEAKALTYYHRGMAVGMSAAAGSLSEYLGRIGAKGGTQKGINASEQHQRVLAHVLDVVPKNSWRTLPDLEEGIRAAARQIEGENAATLSDNRLKEILRQKDIVHIVESIERANRGRRSTE